MGRDDLAPTGTSVALQANRETETRRMCVERRIFAGHRRRDVYPFQDDLYAARNQWYIAAFSRDVGREQLLERWILDEPVVFYRTVAGDAVALEGRCAHRHFPLSKSNLQGDNIQCAYHGFTYNSTGACVHIPAQERIPAACRIKAYPL